MSYSTYWQEFYRKTYIEKSGKAMWDVNPRLSAGKDYIKFQKWMDHKLPLLDIGCGTGAPTAYFAGHFPRVVGIDTAGEAIEIARNVFPSPSMEFRCLDVVDRLACLELQREFGDLNLYMRGVLHQIKPEHKAQVVDNVASLMGKTGIFYFIEVATEIRTYFQNTSTEFHQLPEAIQAIFISHLPPEGITLEEVPQIFPKERFEILEAGIDQLMTNLSLQNGIQITIPAVYSILRRV